MPHLASHALGGCPGQGAGLSMNRGGLSRFPVNGNRCSFRQELACIFTRSAASASGRKETCLPAPPPPLLTGTVIISSASASGGEQVPFGSSSPESAGIFISPAATFRVEGNVRIRSLARLVKAAHNVCPTAGADRAAILVNEWPRLEGGDTAVRRGRWCSGPAS
jgi:hypothetical protein